MTGREIARPLPVLAELIQHNIDRMNEATDKATKTYRIAAGYLLAEARSHSWDDFHEWKKRFGTAARTATHWIAEAKRDAGDNWKWADRPPPSTTPGAIRDRARRQRSRAARDVGRKEEFAREHAKAVALQKMCGELIDAGVRVLSVKYHPDKGVKDDAKFKLLGDAKSFLKKQVYPKKLSEFRS